MRNIFTIANKEFKLFFISPVAYAIAFMVFLVMGILFYINVLGAAANQYAPGIQVVVGPLATILLFTTPGITMRSLAEEQKNGTLETLLTAPVRDFEIVVGKWLGTMYFMILILAVTWVYPLILNQLVSPGIDQGSLIAAYLGMVLMIGAFIAIGVAASSLFSNQIAAFFATLGILLVLWLIGSTSTMIAGTTSQILGYLDMSMHYYETFYQGVIELKDVIYYLSVISLALFLGSLSVETRRWR